MGFFSALSDFFGGLAGNSGGSAANTGSSSSGSSAGASTAAAPEEKKSGGLGGFFSRATGFGSDRVDPASAAILGGLTGGLPGLVGGAASAYTRNAVQDRGGIGGLFGGLFGGGGQSTSRLDQGVSLRPRSRTGGDAVAPSGIATMFGGSSSPTPPQPTTPEAPAEPAKPTMSEEAAKGSYGAIPNPNYDPTNPMSPRFLINPTYEQLLAYRNYQLDPTGTAPTFTDMSTQLRPGMNYTPVQTVQPPVRMAEGGEVQGGNDKTVISDAISAVKGQMAEQDAAIALGMFVQRYGRDALVDLVDRVRSGEMDDSASRSEGRLRGPGDGMNDRIPASIDGKQDVLLSDGEFIVPADVVSGLGNGSSDAGAKELERFMARVRAERTGNAEQPNAVNPADVLPV